jgi:hypothetical protein
MADPFGSVVNFFRELTSVFFGAPRHIFCLLVLNQSGVWRFNAETGALIDEFVTSGSGGISFPSTMEAARDGFLYIPSPSGTRGSWMGSVL